MKVACVQFAPKLGKTDENIARVNTLLHRNEAQLRAATADGGTLWIVLPEMALTGLGISLLY